MEVDNWNIDQFVKDVDQEIIDNILPVIGAQCVTWADEDFDNYSYSEATEERTANLRHNLSYSTNKTQSSPKHGQSINLAESSEVRIGGNVEYLARYVLGFVGLDSLGRSYHQQPRPILQNLLTKKKESIKKIFDMALK